jgi:hypothetical protein
MLSLLEKHEKFFESHENFLSPTKIRHHRKSQGEDFIPTKIHSHRKSQREDFIPTERISFPQKEFDSHKENFIPTERISVLQKLHPELIISKFDQREVISLTFTNKPTL